MDADALVVGGGPAAWAAATALATQGLATTLVAPQPFAPWPANYGVWLDELAGLDGLDDPDRADRGDRGGVFERTWPAVTVVAGTTHLLSRGYGRVDNEALARRLRERFEAAGGTVVTGAVRSARGVAGGVSVAVAPSGDDGGPEGRELRLEAKVVVDASGHEPVLVRRPAKPAPAFQAAWGVVATCDRDPIEAGTCVLMDWSGPDDADPTFLYAMDLGGGRWFLEETSLARRPALGSEVLQRRLEQRLAGRGVRLGEVDASELVLIPMGAGLPATGQVAVPFGAAAGLVHPATGYSLSASLRLAPVLAAALGDALRSGATPARVVAAGEQAVWPASRRKARQLEQYGLDALLRFDRPAVQAFFDAFFSLPEPLWQGYLSGTLPPGDVARLMQRLFRAASPRLKALLAGGNPLPLVRALTGRG